MKVTVVGYYEVDTSDRYGAYGTNDPVEMAEIDEEQLEKDPAQFLELVDLQVFGIMIDEFL